MTCLWQHKNATQHDLGSKKPIFFNCLLDGAHTSIDAGLLTYINKFEKSVLFHEIYILFKNRFRFADSPDQTIVHPHYGIAELFESLQAV